MKTFVVVLTSILLVFVALVVLAQAEAVGRITQVEGRVDFLKGGKLPAAAAKLDDSVEVGDVLRTKSLSKAQVTFMDNTVITVSPESRIAIEEYMFDPGKGKRSAVLQLFQGLAHVVVSKLFKVTEPDFVVKTHTAVMGVRGTEVGLRIHPNNTTILNFEGHTEVGNIFPEVGDLLFKKAYKIAFSWGGPSMVQLHNMQGTSVFRGLPPTQPFTITQQDRQLFMGQMGSGLTGRRGTGTGTQTATGGTSGSGSSNSSGGNGSGETGGGAGTSGSDTSSNLTTVSLGGPDSGLGSSFSSSDTGTLANLPAAVITPTTTGIAGTGLTANQVIANVIITPTLTTTETTTPTTTTATTTTTTTPTPTPQTYNFQATTYTKWDSTATSTGSTVNSTGWAQGTADWSSTPLYYTSSSTNASRTLVQGSAGTISTGTSGGILAGSVTGIPGSTLTGYGTYTGRTSTGESITFSGSIVVDPSGQVTFTYSNGTLSSNVHLLSGSGTITYTPGTYVEQTTDGAILRTSTSPYTSATSTTTGTGLWAGSSRAGVLPGSFDFAVTGTETSPWSYSYLANELGDVTGTMQGVVSPLSGGGYQGAMTIFSSSSGTPFTSSLLTQFQPSFYLFPGYNSASGPTVSSIIINPDGSASGTDYATHYQDWRFATSILNLSQTVPQTAAASPVSAIYNFQEAYNGAFMLNSSALSSATGMGWGQRTFNGTGSTAGTSVYNTYFSSYDNGNWTATTGTLPASYGSSLTPGSGTTAGTAKITGSVSGTLGQTLSGSMTYIGSLLNGASFSYSGPVSISNDGYLTFTYKNGEGYTSSWVYPGGATGTASGTMYQSPGYHFTQTMSGDSFTVTQTSANNWNISLSNSTASTGGSRSGVYAGSIGNFASALSLYSPTAYALPSTLTSGSGTGAVTIDMEGVASYSSLGAVSGVATANINLISGMDQLSLGFVPGNVTLTNGGSFFSPAAVFVQNNTASALQVVQNTGSSYLTQTPSYSFSETLQGFRISTVSASPTLSSIEGYAWGQRTGSSALSGSGYNYLSYFVSQDLGTRASASAMSSSILGVTGTLSGTLSGTLGQTLSGQATLTGTNSSGTSFTYQGTISVAANGTLVYNYGGNWSTPSGQTGTGSGLIQQVPGTYFTETVTGNYQQAANTSGGVNFMSTTNPMPLSGTRTMDPGGANATTTSTSAAFASGYSSTVNTLTPASGSISMTVNGVVAGAAWQSKWGVASISGTTTPTGGTANTRPTTTGPVTIDSAGTLTTQSVGSVANASGSPDILGRNLVSVTNTSGLIPASFATTATGPFSQTATSNGGGMTVTTPTPLPGTSGSVPVNANLNITSTALQPGSYASGSGSMTVNHVGVVAGPPGGSRTGVSTVHAVKTVGSTTVAPLYVGSTTMLPTSGSAPATLTTTFSGINSVPLPPVSTGAGATQTGTLMVTPR